MGNGAKIGLVGVLALIVLVVAVWDKTNEDAKKGDLRALPVVPAPKALEAARVKKLPEPPREDRLIGQLDHNGPLATRGTAGGAGAPPAAGAQPSRGEAAESASPAAPPAAPAAPPAPPAPSAPSAPPAGKRYRIQPRDTLSSIAAAHYGNRGKWRAIFEANRSVIADPDRLPAGKEIVIPPLAPQAAPPPATAAAPREGAPPALALPAGRTASAGQRTHVVEAGETLSSIAEKTLGSRAKWKAIFEANKEKLASPDALELGMELTIPE